MEDAALFVRCSNGKCERFTAQNKEWVLLTSGGARSALAPAGAKALKERLIRGGGYCQELLRLSQHSYS